MAQPDTRANAGIVLGSLRSRVPGVARLRRSARKVIHMLKIKFAVCGIMEREQKVPCDIESPVPFEVGQRVYHESDIKCVTYEVASTRWIVGDSAERFYQEVELEAPKSKT